MANERPGPSEEARLAAVLEEYARFLHDAVSRLCPRRLGLQADDLEQEARVRLWKALQGERPILDVASYIYRVAATTTIDAIRRLKARREQALEADAPAGEAGAREPAHEGPDEEKALDRRRLLAKVERVLARLEDRRRQVVRLHLQGFTTTEMAALLGSTEPAARNLLHRGLKELRERLREEGITYAGD